MSERRSCLASSQPATGVETLTLAMRSAVPELFGERKNSQETS
ncbi:uncharacterized protein METZ01_LOCUS243689 [marine metagenome]|uniref:Uncharacterized protein n=1 Tax=marine metagenome TaxID=408172 RepID=A0A382HUP6_9ZZZZ